MRECDGRSLFWWGLDRGFLWILKSGQHEDLDGSAQRILIDREEPRG
ncbi:cbb3-type cytochrome oxidase assembly protein CcoS [Mesorhizobium sp. M0320]